MSLDPRRQHDLAASITRAGQVHLLAPRFQISAFQRGELLHQTHSDIRGLRERELFC